MVWKIGKVLCSMFLFAILGVDPTKKPGKIQKVVSVLIQLTNSSIGIM